MKTDTSDTTTTDTTTAGTGAAAASAGGTPPPASLGAAPPAAEPTVHAITRPLGMEFPVTDHESIAAKLKTEVEHVYYEIETDLENGVHRLKGWLKGSAA